jgi:predicted extracellular nuclease
VTPAAGEAAGGRPARIGILYDRERVPLVERMGESSRSPVLVREVSGRPELSFSPGLVALGELAFRGSRGPLAAEFLFGGRRLFVIVAQLAGRRDAPPFGRIQPPKRPEDALRMLQARTLHAFVSSILTSDPDADVIVLANANEPAWAPAVLALKGPLLFDLAERDLPPEERYNYVDRGSCEDRDHILVSANLLERGGARLEIVHRYAEYARESRSSGHDPMIAALKPR